MDGILRDIVGHCQHRAIPFRQTITDALGQRGDIRGLHGDFPDEITLSIQTPAGSSLESFDIFSEGDICDDGVQKMLDWISAELLASLVRPRLALRAADIQQGSASMTADTNRTDFMTLENVEPGRAVYIEQEALNGVIHHIYNVASITRHLNTEHGRAAAPFTRIPYSYQNLRRPL